MSLPPNLPCPNCRVLWHAGHPGRRQTTGHPGPGSPGKNREPLEISSGLLAEKGSGWIVFFRVGTPFLFVLFFCFYYYYRKTKRISDLNFRCPKKARLFSVIQTCSLTLVERCQDHPLPRPTQGRSKSRIRSKPCEEFCFANEHGTLKGRGDLSGVGRCPYGLFCLASKSPPKR